MKRLRVGVTMVSYTEKIDVLDLLINILQDHEAKLDELVSRLDWVLCKYQHFHPPTLNTHFDRSEAVEKV